MLAMTGRVTGLGISRWAGNGGSYRTTQRFLHTAIPWGSLNWQLCRDNLTQDAVILIAGDASTITKSGKCTHGLGKFFSSIYSRAVPGIAFQQLSLVDVATRKAWPIWMEQIAPTLKKTQPTKARNTSSNKPGRPKGSLNKNRQSVTLNAELTQLHNMLRKLLGLIQDTIQPVYFVYDGALGNNHGVQLTRQLGLHLISKLRNNSALHFLWQGEYAGQGRKRIYGERVDYQQLPDQYLVKQGVEDDIETRVYQFQARNRKIAHTLNVVVILKRNLQTQKQARIILFSTDASLSAEQIIEYYRLRFQIEFNFRDAKQYWGLEDFMSTSKQSVVNSANLSMWMVNVSHNLLAKEKLPSVLDLKACYRARFYALQLFKTLPQSAQTINIERLLQQIPWPGRIHPKEMAA